MKKGTEIEERIEQIVSDFSVVSKYRALNDSRKTWKVGMKSETEGINLRKVVGDQLFMKSVKHHL